MMRPAPRWEVMALPDYAPADVQDREPILRCHRNENALGAPPHVMEALRAMQPDDVARYPDARYPAMLAAVARSLALDPACIAAGNGADEILSALIDAYGGRNRNVVIMRPSFAWYARFAKRSGAEVREVPYRTRWALDPADVLARCDALTGLVIVGNPNNPTGELLSSSALCMLLERLPRALIAVDETYVELSQSTHAGLLRRFQNLAIVRSMSKVPGLAGLRVGFVASTPAVAGAVRRWIQPYSVNAAAAIAATAYLEGGRASLDFAARYRQLVARSLGAIADACRPIACAVYPSAANFVLADFDAQVSRVSAAFVARGICVRRYDDEPDLRTCLRINAYDDAGTAAIVSALASLDVAARRA